MPITTPRHGVVRRIPRDERRRQLLATARQIVRDGGTDRLTLGHLAVRAGVSKPVVYDHFATPASLLIALYRWLDGEVLDAFRDAMAVRGGSRDETIDALAAAYIDCATDIEGEVHAVGRALAGSAEKNEVYQELLDHAVAMFVSVLTPHSVVPADAIEVRCIALVGAGEALSAAVMQGTIKANAVASFIVLIQGAV